MATVADTVRRYKLPLIVGAALATAGFGISLCALQSGASPATKPFYFLVGFGFLVNLLWLPLWYLAWFGQPKAGYVRFVQAMFFWLVAALCCLFWVRTLLFLVQGQSLGT